MMTTTNDITGDSIASKAKSNNYRNNYEAIFNKKPPQGQSELDERVFNSKSDDRSRESKPRRHAENEGIPRPTDQKQAVKF